MSPSKGEFFRLLKKSRLLTSAQRVEAKRLCQGIKDTAAAEELVKHNLLTSWQAAQLLRGKTRFHLGKYKLLKFRGRGAMGIVFKAEHPELDRTVAVKVLSNSLLDNPRSVARFLREIRSAAILNHPNIVVAYDADQVDNTYCLVMEYVSGRSLKAIWQERGRLPVLWSCECARQAALALDHIHTRGLVHRDVKPSNLIVTKRADNDRIQVKLLDVGLARFVSEAEQDGGLTRDGQIVGTGDFMAPEQVAQARLADIRADIYGLGATLYQITTGAAPLVGSSLLKTYMNRLQGEPPLLSSVIPDVPRGLDAVVAKMLKKSPQDRYQTPGELAADLAAVLAGNVDDPILEAIPEGTPVPGSPNSDFYWAPIEPVDLAANPFRAPEFVDFGDSVSEVLTNDSGSSSGNASSTDTATDASMHDFMRLVSESPASAWEDVAKRQTSAGSARVRSLTADASRAVRKLVRRIARQDRPAGTPEKKATPKTASKATARKKKRPAAAKRRRKSSD
jgi:serine/threonine protein kinase